MTHFLKTFVITAFFAGTGAAIAADAEFHPSTYTTYKQHNEHKGSVRVLNRLPSDELSYTEIGIVRISTDEVFNYYDALAEIKEAAARHGGNAIVLADDAKLFSAGGVTARGTMPRNVSAIAVIQH